MDEKKAYVSYCANFGRGKKEGNPIITMIGEANKVESGATKDGDPRVRLTLKANMQDKTLQYWFPEVTPHEDHSIEVRVTLLKERATRFLQHLPAFGQKVLVEIQKPTLDKFKRRDGTDDFNISGFAGNIAVVQDDRFYIKRVQGTEPPRYERIQRLPLKVYDFNGNEIATGAAPAAAAPAAAPKAAPAAPAAAPSASPFPSGVFTLDEFDDDDLPF